MRALVTFGLCMLALGCSIDQETNIDGGAGSTGGDSGNGGSGGFPGNENCENAVDDDSDGLIDCADDECSTYACAPIVPAGWSGPVALYMGTDASPSCDASGGFAVSAFEGGTLTIPAYTCPACSCNPASAVCEPTVISYTALNCSGQQLPIIGAGCQIFNSSSTQQSIRLQFNSPAVGTCTPSADVPTVPAPTQLEQARVCALPPGSTAGGGCFADACVPKPAAPFLLCIYGQAAAPCPESYPSARTIVTEFEDQRGCAACSCATPSCGGSAAGYDDSCGSGTPIVTANTHNQCANMTSSEFVMAVEMIGTAACAPAGGEPLGDVVRTELLLCCKS